MFHYLFNTRIKDISFVLEDALSFEGSTGPYVQYTYARTCSILEKAAAEGLSLAGELNITTDEEADVIKVLSRFPERVLAAIEDYEPSYIARYAIEVATAFNRFYHNCPILSADDENVKNTRVLITKAAGIVLKSALRLICMKAPEKI